MNKKGLSWDVIKKMIMVILAMFVIGGIFAMTVNNISQTSFLEACRESIRMSENTVFEIEDYELGHYPLACVTMNVDIPNTKDSRNFEESLDGTKENFAELIADTYYEFYDGKVDKNVFGQYYEVTDKDKCFVAFNVSIPKKYAFSPQELEEYLKETNYYANPVYSTKTDSKTGEVVEATSECEHNGGECKKSAGIGQVEFSKWACVGSKTCFVGEENMVSYYQYIEEDDLVKIYIDSENIGTFDDSQNYAIVFLSPTENPHWELTNHIYNAAAYIAGTEATKFWGKSFIIVSTMNKISDYCVSNIE